LLRSEWPGLPSTELQRRLELPPAADGEVVAAAGTCCLSAHQAGASPSPPGAPATPLCRLARERGMCWNVSRKNAVISSSR